MGPAWFLIPRINLCYEEEEGRDGYTASGSFWKLQFFVIFCPDPS